MWRIVEHHPNKIQLPLVAGGYLLALFYGRQLPALAPPLETIPPHAVSSELYDWSTVQLGLALVALGIVLSNRSALHRIRAFRLPRTQRLAAFGCALALTSPWITVFLAGVPLGFADPFTAIWSIAFIGGFAGLGGFLVLGVLRAVQEYGTSSDRFPYVDVDTSRRKAIRGGTVALLGGGGIVASFAVGRVTLGESWPPYHGRAPVTYERDDLRAQAVADPARLGDSITFEITNTGAESITLGCNNPWALQAYEDGGWHHVTWTAGRYYSACATLLEPGATTTATVPLSEAAIADDQNGLTDPARELRPGTYRFVLLGPDPYLAVNFQALQSP